MGHLALAIQNLAAAQHAYESARLRHAPAAELVILAEAMSRAILAHGAALQATPRSQWQAETDAAIAPPASV